MYTDVFAHSLWSFVSEDPVPNTVIGRAVKDVLEKYLVYVCMNVCMYVHSHDKDKSVCTYAFTHQLTMQRGLKGR